MSSVPTLRAEDLSEAQARALMIADNQLGDLSDWDNDLLADHFEFLLAEDLDFDIEDTGFDYGEIEVRVMPQSEKTEKVDPVDHLNDLNVTARASEGDIWALGEHRVICADALETETYINLLGDQKADVVFTDPPYNLKPSEIGKTCRDNHGSFAMASGEMSRDGFTKFLTDAFTLIKTHSSEYATVFTCMDWRHLIEVQTAGDAVFDTLRNLCVWAKDRAGMGSFYRSQHELIFVWQANSGAVQNHIQLGKNGRNRSNLWEYPSALNFKSDTGELANATRFHPTVKPVAMVADALLDVSRKGDAVLDPFLGSGSTLIGAEQTGRRAFGIEIDPKYVDVALARWEQQSGQAAERIVEGSISDAE